MAIALLLVAALAAAVALAAKDRERVRALMALDAERRAHALTRSERDGLRDALDRAVADRGALENEVAEVRALRDGVYR